MYLEELLNKDILEDDKIECKQSLNRTDILDWLKTIAGFSNADGGTMYIGVADKTNKLIGFSKEEIDGEKNYINNQLNEHLFPRPFVKISFLPYEIKGNTRYVLEVDVPSSTFKPVILKYKGVPSIFMRRDGYTNGATYEEIIEMSNQNKNVQFDTSFTDVKFSFDDFKTLRDFYAKHNNGKQLKEKALLSKGFYNEDGYLSNGALLFKDDYAGDKSLAQCSLFSGFTRGSERIVTINKYNGNLISVLEKMLEFVEQRMNHSLIKKDTGRINLDAYPKRALFEGLVNAIAHRDYFLDGSQIQIDMFKDRLEISSPGKFYRGDNIEKTYDLSNIISKRRNDLISSILVMCNVMEAAGTGFEKIMEEYKDYGDEYRPFICSSSDHFTLTLPDLTYREGMVNDSMLPTVEFLPLVNASKHDDKILSYCYFKGHNAKEIADFLGISDSTYFRNTILKRLVNANYLVSKKVGNSLVYKTNVDEVKLS